MDAPKITIITIVLIVLLVCSAFFSSCEIAYASVNRIKLQKKLMKIVKKHLRL